jgi:hypothetical protein
MRRSWAGTATGFNTLGLWVLGLPRAPGSFRAPERQSSAPQRVRCLPVVYRSRGRPVPLHTGPCHLAQRKKLAFFRILKAPAVGGGTIVTRSRTMLASSCRKRARLSPQPPPFAVGVGAFRGGRLLPIQFNSHSTYKAHTPEVHLRPYSKHDYAPAVQWGHIKLAGLGLLEKKNHPPRHCTKH